jgi:DNA-binding transcriptional LysR family regulator
MRFLKMRNVPQLSLSALDIFRQVAREGSIVGAAARLNRVQSNVSTRIRQLEEQLGKVLFLRGSRRLQLTEDGAILLRYADRLISLSHEAVDALNSEEPSGTLRIGTMESTATSRLPRYLSDYHARYPNVHIHLEVDTAGGLADRLLAHEIDAAFIAEPLELANVTTEATFEEQLMLVVPPGFPSLRRRQDISGATIVAFEEGCAYRRYLQEWLAEEGIEPGTVLSVGSYLAILACVAAGTGYAVIPKSVLDAIASEGEFRTHRLPRRYTRIKTLLAWRDGFRSRNLDALRAILPSGNRQNPHVQCEASALVAT